MLFGDTNAIPINIITNYSQTQLECASPNRNIPHKTPDIVTKNATWLAKSGPDLATVKTKSVYAVAPIKDSQIIVHVRLFTGSGIGIKLSVKNENIPKINAANKLIPHDNLTGPIPSIPRRASVIFSSA